MASSKSQTTDVPEGRNDYFYFGWDAHAAGIDYEHRAPVDWRLGWMERERMIREATYAAIAEG
jgi:hypothetical protein